MNKRELKWLLPVGLLAILLAQVVGRPELRALFSTEYWSNWWRYGQVIRLVEAEFVHADDVDFHQLTDVALQSAVRALDDYSDYMTPDAYRDFNMAANQEYVGVGIEIEKFAGRIALAQVFPQGSAHEAGILPGDFIVAVDDEALSAELPQAFERIHGVPGSFVTLTVERLGKVAPLEFELERRAITLDAVVDVGFKSEGVGYLKLRQFTDAADQEVLEAVDQLMQQGMQALIIDLRGNPGGRVMTAAHIAELFLEEGQRILSIESRRGEAEVLEVHSAQRHYEIPLAVLIDGGSASASEILSGALRDHRRAVLIGEKSYGKGSVQSVYQFASGDALKLTSARYLLPDGEAINGTGVYPDVEVKVTQQDRALILLQSHHLRRMDQAGFVRDFGFAPLEDRPVNTAVDILDARLQAPDLPASGSSL